jgi:hypothetical protein
MVVDVLREILALYFRHLRSASLAQYANLVELGWPNPCWGLACSASHFQNYRSFYPFTISQSDILLPRPSTTTPYRTDTSDKMKAVFSAETLAIPEGVTAKIRSRVVTVTGPRGTLTKDLSHIAVSSLMGARRCG